jgi:hypothetical protein
MKKGESQRIYWQQWLSANAANGGHSRRELITSSAAIRISPDAAKAKDVTQLLRKTLDLSSLSNQRENAAASDALVLVGTLYSLPNDYVQFEHTLPTKAQQDSSSMTVITSCQSDPFHVVKTLEPEDNPLATRDKMMEHLRRLQDSAPAGRSIISPKLQWYFVPSSQPSTPPSPIPSCIELDGYCTSMEEEEYASDEEDEDPYQRTASQQNGEKDETVVSDETIFSRDDPDTLMFKALSCVDPQEMEVETHSQVHAALEEKQHEETVKQLRRYIQIQMTQSHSTAVSQISGYLMKQSHVDRHVWRRVHCVLTDDHLWYVTRMPYSPTKTFPRVAKKHGRISLGRALLLEPNTDYSASPTYRIPNAFEVVSSRGTSHVFRAPSRALQRHWIQALSTKIMESFENSLMSQAELIVADESIARNKRLTSLAVDPLWNEIESESNVRDKSIASVLRIGMDISEYREQCRHIQAFFPAKNPVVVLSESSSASRARKTDTKPEPTPAHEPIDPKTKELVQATWDMATALLSKATNVAMEIQQGSDAKQISRSLEVLCRHVDYVITGQHRQLLAEGGFEANGSSARQRNPDPPPIDLFDLLLAELQSFVGSNTMSC